MHLLRQVAIRAASSASRSLTSAPRSTRHFSSRIPSAKPAPFSSLYAQRRFASDDAASREVKTEETTEEVKAEEAAPVVESVEQTTTEEVQVEEPVAVTESTSQTAAESVNAEEAVPAAESTTQTATHTPPPSVASKASGYAAAKGIQSARIEARQDKAYRTLYLGNIYFGETNENLREFVSQVAIPEYCELATDADGRNRGFGFAVFETPEVAKKVHEELNLKEFGGRVIVIRPQAFTKRPTTRPEGPTSTIYIRNIDSGVTDRELNELFRPLAKIRDVRIAVNRRTGLPRGFAHADFDSIEAAQAAMEKLSGLQVRGKGLVVDFSLPAKYKPEGTRNPRNQPDQSEL